MTAHHRPGRGTAQSLVRFVFSRAEFRAFMLVHSLILADFSTAPKHISHASERAEDAVQPDSNTTIVSLGISFSHVSSGLPFDFSLQSGLVKVQASGGSSRRLAAR